MACASRCSFQLRPQQRSPAASETVRVLVRNVLAHRTNAAARGPAVASAGRHPQGTLPTAPLKSLLLGAGLGMALSLSPHSIFPSMAADDSVTCMKKCTKECNKIAPGSPGYCEETCADECSFMSSGADAGEADGKERVGNLGFLGEDLEGNSLDKTLSGLFSWGRVGAANEPYSRK